MFDLYIKRLEGSGFSAGTRSADTSPAGNAQCATLTDAENTVILHSFARRERSKGAVSRPRSAHPPEKDVDMDKAQVIPITEDDDRFHPYSTHPYETETFWVSFHWPERRLGGWLYNQVLFNQGVCHGGAWVWDDSPAGALYEVNQRDLPLVDKDQLDLRDVRLPNGNHIQMIEPLTEYRVRRNDTGRLEADLVFHALREPHSHPLGV